MKTQRHSETVTSENVRDRNDDNTVMTCAGVFNDDREHVRHRHFVLDERLGRMESVRQ